MISKVFKVIWIITLLMVCGILFYTYSALSDQVSLGLKNTIVSRSVFFYGSIILIALFNGLAFSVVRVLKEDWKKSWFYGLLCCLHIFLSSTFIFIAILNSNERFDYIRLGPALAGSLILLVGWVLTLPVWIYFNRSLSRS
ncbi:MAG: hypothetical protein ACO3FI_09440 [Cyclobacteriaceae bacterium]